MSAEGENQLPLEKQLVEASLTLYEEIVSGERTEVAAVDEYLRIERDRNAELARVHPETEKQDKYRRWSARYENILNGRYCEEKATFCFSEAEDRKILAARTERDKYNPAKPFNSRLDALIEEHRRAAANWYRIGARCLETPDPVPDNIPPQEQV